MKDRREDRRKSTGINDILAVLGANYKNTISDLEMIRNERDKHSNFDSLLREQGIAVNKAEKTYEFAKEIFEERPETSQTDLVSTSMKASCADALTV